MFAQCSVFTVISAVALVFMVINFLEHHLLCGKDPLKDLCHQYEQGMIAGSLCHDLCQTETVTLDTCLSTEPEKSIYIGILKGRETIIKMHKHNEMDSDSFIHFQTYEDFRNKINETVNMLFGECENCSLLTERLAYAADVNNDGYLSLAETVTMVTLLQTPEPSLLLIINGSKHFPKMHGYCGRLYAVEKVPVIANRIFGDAAFSLNILPNCLEPIEEMMKELGNTVYESLRMFDIFKHLVFPFLHDLSLSMYQMTIRARIPSLEEKFNFSFSLLDAIFALSNTPYGMLQSCDSHIGNFGLSENFEVKMIDVDETHPTYLLQSILGATACERDRDCKIGDTQECTSKCDTTKGFCSAVLEKQNLQNICPDLLPLFFRNNFKVLKSLTSNKLICLEKAIGILATFCQSLPLAKNGSDLQKNIESVKERLLNLSLGKFDCE